MKRVASFLAAILLAFSACVAVAAPPAVLIGPAAWSQPGSSVDLDLQGNRATVYGQEAGLATGLLSITRTTPGYAQYQNGCWQNFPSGAFRDTDKGLLVEEARTNSALWSRDMTNAAWVKTTMTTALNATGIDCLPNDATTLTATGANATILQTLTAVSEAETYSVSLERVSGTGTIDLSLNGTLTPVVLTTSWQRFSVEATVLNPIIGIQIVTNGDVILADFNQDEEGSAFATSPILTTTVAVTRNADVVTANRPALFSLQAGSAFAEWLDLGPVSSGGRIFEASADANNFIFSGRNATNNGIGAFSSAGVTTSGASSGTVAAGVVYRIALAFAAGDTAIAFPTSLNPGGIITGTGAVPVGAPASVGLGSNQVGGNTYLNSYLRRLTWFPTRLTNAQLLAWAQTQPGP